MVQRNQSARDSARWAFGQGLKEKEGRGQKRGQSCHEDKAAALHAANGLGQRKKKYLTVFSHQSAGVVAEEYAAIKSMIHWASPVDGREFTRQEILLVCLCFSV